MKLLLILPIFLLVSCATVNVNVIDYCQNQDGSFNEDDIRCKQQERELHDYSNRRQ